MNNVLLMGGGIKTVLPAKLITNPATVLEQMDATTGWGIGPTGTVAVNTSEKYSGSGSLKVTTGSGGQSDLYRTCNYDLSTGYRNVGFRFYLHSEVSTVKNAGFLIYLSTTADYSKHFYASISVSNLLPNRWYSALPSFIASGGAVWTDPIIRMKFSITGETGQVAIVSFDELSAGVVSKPAVMLTFDDAGASINQYALPYMAPRKLRGTMYAIGNTLSGAYITRLQELQDAGWDIGNHSHTHVDMTTLTQEQVRDEFVNCKNALDALGFTRASDHAAYPYGAFNATVRAGAIDAAIKTGRIVSGIYSSLDYLDPLYVRSQNIGASISLATAKTYIDTAIANGRIVNFLFHTIVPSGAVGDQWNASDYYALMDYIQQQKIQTLTVSEMYRLLTTNITVKHK